MTKATDKIVNSVANREPVFHPDTVDDNKRFFLVIKRISDILISILGIIVLSPVWIITAIVVFLEHPRCSPIFVQDRIGKNGKTFRFYKFRSMCPDAEAKLESLLKHNEMEGHAFKMKDDPRITKVGKFLRKTSIDELPQLVNVLKGDMSIVGPRPPLPREVERYDDYELQRLYVTPGLTCYWQTTPNRNDMTFAQWLELDLKYIRERSAKTDLIIIFRTFSAVFGMNGI